MHYVLTSTRVESFDRITHAQARATEVDKSIVVSRMEDLEKLDSKLLVAVYNLAATEPESGAHPVGRFSDSKAAARRTWPVIEYLAKPGTMPEPSATTTTSAEESADMAAKKKKAPKKATTPREPGAGRPSAFSGKFIYKLTKENPRRVGTAGFKAWDLVRNGMTYEQYIEAGGERKHLVWDLEHKFIEVKTAKA